MPKFVRTAVTASAAAAAASRSAYVSKVRRAFLLRVHPDRFRSQPEDVRRSQAALVQAISDRMARPDFLAYTCASGGAQGDKMFDLRRGKGAVGGNNGDEQSKYEYVLERKDGSLLRRTLNLDDSVVSVLNSMADALASTGAAKLPSPPSPPVSKPNEGELNGLEADYGGMNGILWAVARSAASRSTTRDGTSTTHQSAARQWGVDHQFDVNTLRGRDLRSFLRSLDPSSIEDRRASRMDAAAAALVARRAYGFQSIDGTGMGWSSASLARCLMALTALHDEHGDRLRVKSFYPLRLVISSDEMEERLDLHGGTLMLNPAATPLQWLQTLMLVTEEKIEIYKSNQEKLRNYARLVQQALNITVRKGHTCGSREYHAFLERLSNALAVHQSSGGPTDASSSSTALTLERMVMTVESSQSCRRAVPTREGTVRVGADMSGRDILSAISNLGPDARRRALEERENGERCKERMKLARGEFGLHDVHRSGRPSITSDQMLECLGRLLAMESVQRDEMKCHLAGNSLGVTGSGHFCHLGDDGSIVIPWDWR